MRAPFDPDIWAKCVDALAQHIPEQQFNTWIRPLVATVTTDPLKITLQVANRF
ncbi:MAG: DnaA N-terminal domain-containing protein, partial [Burkholderiaceae bacterium]